MFAVDTVPIDKAADTAHGPSGIGEWKTGLKSRLLSYTEMRRRHNSWPQRRTLRGFICKTRKGHREKHREYMILKQKIFYERTKPCHGLYRCLTFFCVVSLCCFLHSSDILCWSRCFRICEANKVGKKIRFGFLPHFVCLDLWLGFDK